MISSFEEWRKDNCLCCDCLEDGKKVWAASREALWKQLDTTDFLVMGAQATQSATVENKELWDVYWRAVDLIKAKLKESALSSNKESGG